MRLVFLVGMLVGVLRASGMDDSREIDKNLQVVWATAGGEAALPCDVSVPKQNDGVSTVLWFKDSTGMPLYSLDFRGGPLVHLATTDDIGTRTHFVLEESKPQAAYLNIKSIMRSDEGIFRCRVDFFDSPTRNQKVNLSIIVPSNEPKIFDGEGREITGIAGPFREEYDLFLSCQVTGGKPIPEVTWWHNSILLDSIEDPTSRQGTIVKQLFINTVTRSLLSAKFQCKAQVSQSLPPVVKEIQIQVYLKPLFVHIVTPNELLSAGKPQALRCETQGSYPAARLSWLLDGETIRSHHTVTATNTGNSTSSIATLILSASDDGKDLTCRASNPWFPGGMIEETRTIHVAYPPRVTISIGSSEDPSSLKEGEEVQLICNTESRPPADKYAWFKESDQLNHNPGEGLVVLGRTMRIRNLTRDDSGNYSCKAANSEGHTRSQTLPLKVLYVPVCKDGTEPKEVAALRHSSLNLRCEVDSPPEAGQIKFSWTYNKTRDVLPVPASRTTSHGLASELAYTPLAPADFGTLACWATNGVGHQKYPCLFNIIPAKVPESPRECNLINGSRSLEVVCKEGGNGGIPQHFLLEVLDGVHAPMPPLPPVNNEENEISTMNDQGSWSAPLPIPVHRESGESPRFILRGLRPGRKYGLLVYAVNAKGRSSPASILDVTIPESLADQYPQSGEIAETDEFTLSNSHSMAMIFGALIAAAFLIILAIISASAVVLCKRNANNNSTSCCGSDRNKRESGGPSMYAAPDDESGFGLHFASPNVMIRPCADIRRDSRRASRTLSALIASQEDPLVSQIPTIHEGLSEIGHLAEIDIPGSRLSQEIGTYVDHQGFQYVPYSETNQNYNTYTRTEYNPQRIFIDGMPRIGSEQVINPRYSIVGSTDQVYQRIKTASPTSTVSFGEQGDQVLRFPENNIARVEISNKSDVGTVVRFELSKPDLISQQTEFTIQQS